MQKARYGKIKICKGTHRIVIPIPALGIAVKLPRIRLRSGWSNIRYSFFESLKGDHLYWRASWWNTKQFLFTGIADNLREFVFCLQTRQRVLLPTYFSLFGLLNIQRLGRDPVPMRDKDFCEHLYRLTEGGSMLDSHHFVNEGNFFLEHGKLKIADYGSPESQVVTRKHGDRISNEFDPNYRCEGKSEIWADLPE